MFNISVANKRETFAYNLLTSENKRVTIANKGGSFQYNAKRSRINVKSLRINM